MNTPQSKSSEPDYESIAATRLGEIQALIKQKREVEQQHNEAVAKINSACVWLQFGSDIEVAVKKACDQIIQCQHDTQILTLERDSLREQLEKVKVELDSIGRASYKGYNFERHFRDLFYRCELLNQSIPHRTTQRTEGEV